MRRRVLSIWSWPEWRFHYYGTPIGAVPTPAERGRLQPPLGDPPERLVRVAPSGATYLGSGVKAIGEIVTARRNTWAT